MVKVKRLPDHVGSIASKTHAAKEATGEILGQFSFANSSIVLSQSAMVILHNENRFEKQKSLS